MPALSEAGSDDFIQTIRAAGYEVAELTDKNIARMPSTEERLLWRVPEQVPVMQHRRIAWDEQGEALYVTIISHTADLYQVEYNLATNCATFSRIGG